MSSSQAENDIMQEIEYVHPEIRAQLPHIDILKRIWKREQEIGLVDMQIEYLPVDGINWDVCRVYITGRLPGHGKIQCELPTHI